MQLTLERRYLCDLHADDRTWRKLDGPRKIAKRPFAIWRAEPGDVEDWVALKFAAAAFIENRILERDPFRRRADRLERFTQYLFVEFVTASEQNSFGEFRIESQSILQYCRSFWPELDVRNRRRCHRRRRGAYGCGKFYFLIK